MPTVTYIYHSCFVIEGERAVLVIDYWHDRQDGYVANLMKTTVKPVYFLASHFHEDHFSREIFALRPAGAPVSYLLSSDIIKHRKATPEEATASLHRGDVFDDGIVSVTACPSTDVGCSFAIRLDGHLFFHAGDLGDWQTEAADYAVPAKMSDLIVNKKMHGDFLAALRHIRERFPEGFEVAMLPVDPRLGPAMWLTVDEWQQQMPAQQILPMHWEGWGFALPERETK